MKKLAFAAFASFAALTLAACGSSEDASTDAEAENVEIAADEPMAGVDEPVADPNAAENDTSTTDDVDNAIAAGEQALDTVAAVKAAAEDGAENVQKAADGK